MPQQLDVLLGARLVGTITNVAGDINVVALDDDFRNDPHAPVLSFRAFRDALGRYRTSIRPTRTKLHPYFSGLLPEGMLRRYVAEHGGVNDARDFPLLWLLGEDLPGALILRDHAGAPFPLRDVSGESTLTDEHDIMRFSLAGMQLKFSAILGERGLTIPAHGTGGSWILKLPDQRFERVPENEWSMMTFAARVGIDVPRIELIEPAKIAGLPRDIGSVSGSVYAIERFDRSPAGRIHTEDFAQANGIYPAEKYRAFTFDLLVEQVADAAGYEAAFEVIRRIVFSIGIGNGDMHAKNWSLIYRDGRTPSLAPAYDFVSTVVYLADEDLGMNLAGTKAFAQIDEDRLRRLAQHARLPTAPVLGAAREMVERMLDVWPAIAADVPMSSDQRTTVEEHMRRQPLFRRRYK